MEDEIILLEEAAQAIDTIFNGSVLDPEAQVKFVFLAWADVRGPVYIHMRTNAGVSTAREAMTAYLASAKGEHE